jgi:hypothetical protein
MESSERRKQALIQKLERVLIAKPDSTFAERALGFLAGLDEKPFGFIPRRAILEQAGQNPWLQSC